MSAPDTCALQRGRKLRCITWGTHPENGDALASLTVGEHGVVSIEVADEFGHAGYFTVAQAVYENGRVFRFPLSQLTSYEIEP